MKGRLLGIVLLAIASASAQASSAQAELPAIGSYLHDRGHVYVGETGTPEQPTLAYYDTQSRRLGTLVPVTGTHYRSRYAPFLQFDLATPEDAVVEDRHVVIDAGGRFGYSLWHVKGARHRALVVLCQGADDSTRAFGFLVPYFVAHGLDVITYDQRGTGESVGNWRYTSPASKADDVAAALHQIQSDPAVDAGRIGVWGPSNGGWVAPLVTQRYPVAFLILKSAPSESITSNVLYEIKQALQEHARFSEDQIDIAMRFEHDMLDAVSNNDNWTKVQAELAEAKEQPWFSIMRIPPNVPIPPPPPVLAGFRASLIYDPKPVLQATHLPTLALFGARDRDVDAADSAVGFRRMFAVADLKDFTEHTFPDADHLLIDSKTGYIAEEPNATTLVKGYPGIMITWLEKRGFTD